MGTPGALGCHRFEPIDEGPHAAHEVGLDALGEVPGFIAAEVGDREGDQYISSRLRAIGK